MRQLATSSSKARNTMKLNQTLETLKYSHVNPAINASTTITLPKGDRPNATMSNPIPESRFFVMMLAMMRTEAPIATTKR